MYFPCKRSLTLIPASPIKVFLVRSLGEPLLGLWDHLPLVQGSYVYSSWGDLKIVSVAQGSKKRHRNVNVTYGKLTVLTELYLFVHANLSFSRDLWYNQVSFLWLASILFCNFIFRLTYIWEMQNSFLQKILEWTSVYPQVVCLLCIPYLSTSGS